MHISKHVRTGVLLIAAGLALAGCAKASGAASLTKVSTSAGVGGSPVRSKQARRSNVLFSASGENLIFCFDSASTRNASTGVRARSLGFVAGIAGWRIG